MLLVSRWSRVWLVWRGRAKILGRFLAGTVIITKSNRVLCINFHHSGAENLIKIEET
jgi:hypothetical protein